MNVFLSPTFSVEIRDQAFFVARFSNAMKNYFKDQNYGDDLKSLYIGIICVSAGFEPFFKIRKPKYIKEKKDFNQEGFKYSAEKCLEYEFKIDFNAFKNASESERKKLLEENILASLSIFDTLKSKIKDFNSEQFKTDMKFFFKEVDSMPEEKPGAIPNEEPKFLKELNSKKVSVRSKEKAINSLLKLKATTKFDADDSTFYTGVGDSALKDKLTDLVNLCIDEFISVAKTNGSDKDFQACIKQGLSHFNDLEDGLDTEERERICGYFEEMMDAVGLESSGGVLNTWMYGFDPNQDIITEKN